MASLTSSSPRLAPFLKSKTESYNKPNKDGQPSSLKQNCSNKAVSKIRRRLSELCKGGRPDVAQKVVESLPRPRPSAAVLWNTIIIGYICNGMPREALLFYATLMVPETTTTSLSEDAYTYSSLLKACAQTQQLKLGKSIHCRILRTNLSRRAGGGIVANSLLNMYSTTCGADNCEDEDEDDIVKKVFDRMSSRNVVSWNTLIAWYVKTQRFSKALAHFKLMMQVGISPTVVSFVNVFPAVADSNSSYILYGLLIKWGAHFSNDLFSVSSAIYMFSQLSDMEAATKVFNLCPHNSIQVWNTFIHAHLHNHSFLEALHLFLQILELPHIAPDSLTFVASLTAASHLQRLCLGRQLHAYVVKNSMHLQLIVSNALISMYSRCNSIEDAFRVFEGMLERDVVSWNTMVSAFVQNGFDDEGLMLVYEMKKQGMLFDSITLTALLSAASNLRNSRLGKQIHAYLFRHGIRFRGMDSYLIDMYSKSGFIRIAQLLFDNHSVDDRDHVTWNAMIAGYSQNGEMEKAFDILRQMLMQNETPSAVTLASVLPACIPLGAISVGKQIHGFAIRHSLDNNVFVATALVDMYSKCASISCAENMCNSITEKNPVTYTTMILGYGQHGLGERALSLFKTMCESGVKPDAITFVAILSACSYSGLVDKGLHIFESMESQYGIPPSTEHYSCVVDMLGRAGRLLEAYEFVKKLGDEGNVGGIWGSLLGACRIHGKLELGKMIASRLFEFEKDIDMAGYHVLLSNIYADKEMWENVDRVREDMRDRGLRKLTGYSWIEVGGTVNSFRSRDQYHSQCDAIYATLEELTSDMKAAGYNPSSGCELDTLAVDE